MDEHFEGYVEKIIFRNAENGYTVLSLSTEQDDELTCVGSFTFISEGEFLRVSGGFTSHPVYGEQFQVKAYEVREPENVLAMERYLGSGAIRGIGPALAARIVAKFKEDTFRVMDEEPERLAQVKGISEKMARDFAEQFEEKRGMRSAMVFLQQYGISTGLAVKIYQKYGDRMNEVRASVLRLRTRLRRRPALERTRATGSGRESCIPSRRQRETAMFICRARSCFTRPRWCWAYRRRGSRKRLTASELSAG